MKKKICCLPIAISLFLLAGARAQSRDLLDDAGRAFTRGDYAQAIKLLDKARLSSTDCKIPFYLGLSRYRLREMDGAIIELASAVSCNPQSVEFYSALAEAYSAKGDDNLALSAFESVLKLDPKNIPALRAASILYMRYDMSGKAKLVLQQLVALDKKDSGAAADLAAAYAAESQFVEAEHYFTQALSLEPRNVSALVGLGNLYLKTSKNQPAVDVLSRAIRLDQQAYEPLVLRARAYSRLKKYSEALAGFQSALRLGAHDPEIQYYLSQTYRAMGREEDCQRALAEFKRQREAVNRHLDSQREAARMMAEARKMAATGDVAGALARLENARDLDRESPPILVRLAGLYFENHQYDKAQASIQDAIKLAPAQWDYHYLQGLIEKGMGQFGPARESLETAGRLNPSSAEVHNQLGDLAMQRQDFATAVQEFSRALQLSPQDVTYRQNLEKARSSSLSR